ncbi:MAG: permease [Snowella sp.]|nr:permease [Snowella sp.]
MAPIPQLDNALTLFLSQVLLSLPFLLLGILFSSLLLVFVDDHKLIARFPRNRILNSILGSSLGMILPLGQYGVVPVVRRLLLQGAPLPLAISFLIAGPTVNPIVIWFTLSALAAQPRLIFLRIVLTWFMAIVIALVFSSYREKPSSDRVLTPLCRVPLLRSGSFIEHQEINDPLQRSGNLIYEYATPEVHQRPWWEKLTLLLTNSFQESLELIPWLLLGSAIAAVIQIYLPQDDLLIWSNDPFRQLLVLMLFGIVLSLGTLTSTSFLLPLMSNFWIGSSLTFLLTNSVINLKNLFLLLAVFRFRPVLYLTILAIQLILLFGLVLNFYVN